MRNDMENVRKYLRSQIDTPMKNVGGKDMPMSESEYESLLDMQVETFIESFYRSLRIERDRLLAASDWTQVADAPVDAAAWAKYRQALRDLPASINDPTVDVNWPTPPV